MGFNSGFKGLNNRALRTGKTGKAVGVLRFQK